MKMGIISAKSTNSAVCRASHACRRKKKKAVRKQLILAEQTF
jgi:hypothetical protein